MVKYCVHSRTSIQYPFTLFLREDLGTSLWQWPSQRICSSMVNGSNCVWYLLYLVEDLSVLAMTIVFNICHCKVYFAHNTLEDGTYKADKPVHL